MSTGASSSARNLKAAKRRSFWRRHRPSGRTYRAWAFGSSRRRGLPTAASSSLTGASCRRSCKRSCKREPQDLIAQYDDRSAGIVEITGVMRWPDRRQWFTPRDNPAQNVWFVRDPAAIAAAKGWGPVSPFYVEQESPVPPGGWPRPGKLVVQCGTSTRNMQSPGSAWRSFWLWSSPSGCVNPCARRAARIAAKRKTGRRIPCEECRFSISVTVSPGRAVFHCPKRTSWKINSLYRPRVRAGSGNLWFASRVHTG